VRRHIIPELLDAWMAVESSLHDPALDAPPSPMNHPDFAQASARGRGHVLRHD
jgi:hypothetical protein